MEQNTVILSVSEYNSLRDFKQNLEKGNSYVTVDGTTVSPYAYCYSQRYVSTDEAVKEIAVKNESLLKDLNKLTLENLALKNPKRLEATIEDIKKMSIREFLKWRNK